MARQGRELTVKDERKAFKQHVASTAAKMHLSGYTYSAIAEELGTTEKEAIDIVKKRLRNLDAPSQLVQRQSNFQGHVFDALGDACIEATARLLYSDDWRANSAGVTAFGKLVGLDKGGSGVQVNVQNNGMVAEDGEQRGFERMLKRVKATVFSSSSDVIEVKAEVSEDE